jgi:hypothetical protein
MHLFSSVAGLPSDILVLLVGNLGAHLLREVLELLVGEFGADLIRHLGDLGLAAVL